jgi:hypothetical protein
MLYHVDFRIEYPASMSQKDFFTMWAREAEGALGALRRYEDFAADVKKRSQ